MSAPLLFAHSSTQLLERRIGPGSAWTGCRAQLPTKNALRLSTKKRVPSLVPCAMPVAPRAVLNAFPSVIDPVVLRSSVSAISKLMVTLLLGVAAAKRGLLDAATISVHHVSGGQALSKTVYNLFLPSLLFTNVVTTLARGSASSLFWLPLAASTQVLIGLVVGVLGAIVLRLNDSERRVFLVCSGFGNSAALPLLFASALFDGAPGQLASLISSISFYLIGWTGLFWSIAYSALAGMPDPEATPGLVAQSQKKRSSMEILRSASKRVLSPPLVAACSGLVIGLIAPLRTLFVASPIFSAFKTLGTGYSPAAVLILAGSLARKIEPPKAGGLVNPESTLRLRRLALGISFARYALMPLLGLLVLRTGKAVFRTPFVKFAILLEAIMPPAQNSTLILNLEKKPDAAASMARILLAVYLIGVLPVSIGLTYFLGIAGL